MGTFPPLELVSMKRLLGFGPALSSASARAALASRGSHTSWFAWKLKLLDQLIPSGNPTWQTWKEGHVSIYHSELEPG